MAIAAARLFSYQLIEDRFGDGGNDGRIDVNTLMVSLGLRLAENEAEEREIAHKEQAKQAVERGNG